MIIENDTMLNDLQQNLNQKNRKSNFWLEDIDFLKKTNFKDLYYLESLTKHISNFLKNVPIPVLATYDAKYKRIYFSVGQHKKGFSLDVEIAYYDYITLVKRWLRKFYPQYKVIYEIEDLLSENEIYEKIKQGMKFSEAASLTKKVKKTEIGVIEKIKLVEDEFILVVNGESQLRVSGTLQQPMTLKIFLNELKQISLNEEKRKFIFDHSKLIKILPNPNEKKILITYSGKQLLNFFKINFEDLKNYDLIEIEPFYYQWGRFYIKFDSKSLLNDCLELYKKEKEKNAFN